VVESENGEWKCPAGEFVRCRAWDVDELFWVRVVVEGNLRKLPWVGEIGVDAASSVPSEVVGGEGKLGLWVRCRVLVKGAAGPKLAVFDRIVVGEDGGSVVRCCREVFEEFMAAVRKEASGSGIALPKAGDRFKFHS